MLKPAMLSTRPYGRAFGTASTGRATSTATERSETRPTHRTPARADAAERALDLVRRALDRARQIAARRASAQIVSSAKCRLLAVLIRPHERPPLLEAAGVWGSCSATRRRAKAPRRVRRHVGESSLTDRGLPDIGEEASAGLRRGDARAGPR